MADKVLRKRNTHTRSLGRRPALATSGWGTTVQLPPTRRVPNARAFDSEGRARAVAFWCQALGLAAIAIPLAFVLYAAYSTTSGALVGSVASAAGPIALAGAAAFVVGKGLWSFHRWARRLALGIAAATVIAPFFVALPFMIELQVVFLTITWVSLDAKVFTPAYGDRVARAPLVAPSIWRNAAFWVWPLALVLMAQLAWLATH